MPTGQAPLPFPPFEPYPVPQPVTGVQQAWPFTGRPGMLGPGPQPMGALPSAGYAMPPATPTPAPDMFGPGTSGAREAAVAQARAANAGAPAAGRPPMSMNSTARAAAAEQAAAARAPRPSTLVRDMFGPNAPVEDAVTRQARLYDSVGRSPRVATQVGPNPPSSLGPAGQGVRGAPGAGATLADEAVAQAAATAGRSGAGLPPPPGVRPLANPNPFPQMSVVSGGRLANLARGRLGPGLAFAGLTALGNREDNSTLQAAGGAGLLGTMLGGGPAGATAALGAGIAEGTTGRGSSYSRHLQDIYNGEMPEVNSVGDVVSLVPALGMSIPMGTMRTADNFGNLVEDVPVVGGAVNFVTDRLGGMAADMGNGDDRSLLNVPGVKQVAGFLGVDVQPSEEDQQAAARQQRLNRQMVDQDFMFQQLVRAGVPTQGARDAVAEYRVAEQQNQVLNEMGQLGYGKTSDGQIVPVLDEAGEPRTDLEALSADDVRLMTAQGVYSAIPEIVMQEQQRLDSMNRAASLQAIMSRATDPLMALQQQTVDAFNQYGDPVGAAYAQQAMNSQMAALQAMPFIQAIDEQQQWDQRIAQIQQEQLLNDLMYGNSGGAEGPQSVDEVVAGG